MTRALLFATIALLALPACRTLEDVTDPDTLFGHRYDHRDPEERAVLEPQPPPPGVDYFTYPVVLTDLSIRTGPMAADGRRPVELVLLGALPDACTELYGVEEQRMGHIITLSVDMWRPKGAVCAQVLRPYRFYYELAAPLAPGSYTLRLNDAVEPFQVFPPTEDEE